MEETNNPRGRHLSAPTWFFRQVEETKINRYVGLEYYKMEGLESYNHSQFYS